MILNNVKIIVNKQRFIFYILRRINCAIENSCVKAGVFE